MTQNFEQHITDSFDDTMKDHLESDEYKQETWEFNKIYFGLRSKLDSEDQVVLDELFNSMQNSDFEIAREAYYRGIIIGISQSKKIFSNLSIEQ